MSALGQKQTCALQQPMSALPPKADMCGAARDVRFGPKADSCSAAKKKSLFDQLVGDGEHARRNGEAKRPGSLEVDHELELGRLQDRQVGGFFALENPARVDAALAIGFGKAGSVAHQTASCGELAPFIDRRHRVADSQHDKLLALAVEEWRGGDEECPGALSDDGRERGVEIVFRIGAHDNELHPQIGAASCTSRNWLS